MLNVIMTKPLSNGACHSTLYKIMMAILRHDTSEALRRCQYALDLSYFQYCQYILDPDVRTTVLQSLFGDVIEKTNFFTSVQIEQDQVKMAYANLSIIRKEAQSILDMVCVPFYSRKVAFCTGNGYLRKGQKQSQNDKTEHENGKSVKQKSKSKPKVTNDARYGHYCTPQVPNPEPCYNQNYDEFPQTLPSFQQQSLCCENCGGPHATFECQPMNQNFHDSNSSGFDQIQPPQFPVIHQPPQETSEKILQAKEDLMISIETFLKKFNRISFRETPKVLMQAWDKFFEIKHAQSEEVQELLSKLVQDLQSINEELAEYINTPSWNLPTSSYDDDDDEYSFATQEYLMTCSTAITPDSPKTDSLIMVDKHLDTIPETESDEFIKSSVENLVPTPIESEELSDGECDMPLCDDSITFSNPLFDADDDSTNSDDESFSKKDTSSHEEVIHKMSFITYSNPLFDLDEEIISISSYISITREDFYLSWREIELFHTYAGLTHSHLGIENDDYDSEGDILFLEELLSNESSSLPENESFHFNIPSSTRPPAKPPTMELIEPDKRKIFDCQIWDCPDFEASRARGCCPLFTRASNPLLHFENLISKSYRLTFIFKHT
ncbi:hypothetical protein Tco_0823562 [Tanacetum coccineum]|uniref:Uncharacterized protein n=1 Tax=Tanacetum coccineum TaxID=301880 RepID=A0ABQ5AJ85_9ASTR